MVQKKGTNVPPNEYAAAIAEALREELGSSARAVKTIMHWTGASDRAAKYWLAGTRCPNGKQLILLVSRSDALLSTFLRLAHRDLFAVTVELDSAQAALARASQIIATLQIR